MFEFSASVRPLLYLICYWIHLDSTETVVKWYTDSTDAVVKWYTDSTEAVVKVYSKDLVVSYLLLYSSVNVFMS